MYCSLGNEAAQTTASSVHTEKMLEGTLPFTGCSGLLCQSYSMNVLCF